MREGNFMPSSGLFTRIAPMAAVSVVVGISTLGTLLRPAPQDTAARAVASVPPRPFLTATEPAAAPAATMVNAATTAVAPTDQPAAAGQASKPANPASGGPFVAAAPPAQADVNATRTSAPSFPDVQVLDEVSPRETATAPEPQAPENPVAAENPRRAADHHPKKQRKRNVRPAPLDVRESMAGRW